MTEHIVRAKESILIVDPSERFAAADLHCELSWKVDRGSIIYGPTEKFSNNERLKHAYMRGYLARDAVDVISKQDDVTEHDSRSMLAYVCRALVKSGQGHFSTLPSDQHGSEVVILANGKQFKLRIEDVE